MPRVDDHLAIANRTHETLKCLIDAGAAHSPWIATIAFYKGLHVVEGMFAALSLPRSTSHEDREKKLRAQRRFDHIFTHYRSLQTTSCIARYVFDTTGRAFSKFEDYLPESKVLAEVVHHRLHQVETSALKLMAGAGDRLLRSSTLPKAFHRAASGAAIPIQQAGESGT